MQSYSTPGGDIFFTKANVLDIDYLLYIFNRKIEWDTEQKIFLLFLDQKSFKIQSRALIFWNRKDFFFQNHFAILSVLQSVVIN